MFACFSNRGFDTGGIDVRSGLIRKMTDKTRVSGEVCPEKAMSVIHAADMRHLNRKTGRLPKETSAAKADPFHFAGDFSRYMGMEKRSGHT